ncbi:MAG TPA: 23S rRNA (adenine(2503)-C(2))-methyltransferase RlmN [Candidatus Dormibacteraeota bacterium]|jgi:23S rRNA (adenine2503-C2)-methyltransferase
MVASVVTATLASPPITSLRSEELVEWLAAHGQAAFRARQVRGWLARGVASFEEMHDLPAGLRADLATAFRFSSLEPVTESAADGGLTSKLLYRLDGGYTVESVTMRYPRRTTLCISSQVGCPIGCPFCATGQGKFGRNLKAHEILDQALDASRRLVPSGKRLSHVVFMGMGEPMANYAAVVESVRLLADPELLGISPRRMVVSTAGLVPRIAQLAEEKLPVTLAISLHAARDELRDYLVPINRRYPLAELIRASRDFARVTGRRVSYEWVVLAGVNDSDRDADELGKLLDPYLSHLNLIPWNPVDDTEFKGPSRNSLARFADRIRSRGLNVTIRDTRGRDADAACGQLRARALKAESVPARNGPALSEGSSPDA